MVVVAILMLFIALRTQPKKPVVALQDQWDDATPDLETLRTGADRLADPEGSVVNPRTTPRLRKVEEVNPGLLPNSVFRHPTSKNNRILFEQIFNAVGSPTVAHRALSRPDGSYLYDSDKGWLKFNGSRFLSVHDADVPEDLKTNSSVTKDPTTHKVRALGLGDS